MAHSYFFCIHWKQLYICELHDTTEQYLSAFSGWQNLPLPICWSLFRAEQDPSSSFPLAHPAPVPHPQPPGSEPPPECCFQSPWAPLATTTASARHHRPAVPFKMAKETELDPICSELLYCSRAGETKTSLSSIFVIVLLGSPTSVSAENICHSKPVIFKTLTFTSCSGTLTSDKTKKILWHLYITQANYQT